MNLPPFLFVKHILGDKSFPEAPFYWKLLKVGSVSAKGIEKNLPNFQVGWPAPAPPILPVIRVVFLNTEPFE